MHQKKLITAGVALDEAKRVMIMVHGRGADARGILAIADHLAVEDFALLAPQATSNTWYPYSFLFPPLQNEPWLSSAIDVLKDIREDLFAKGFSGRQVYLLGFSQGACLALEFVARYPMRYGGIIAFTGGLIGDRLEPERYHGDFAGTPVFIGSSDPDPHVPVERVNATAALLSSLHANVTCKIYPGMGHTINADEIQRANDLLQS